MVVTHPSTNRAAYGGELHLRPVDHKSDAVTTNNYAASLIVAACCPNDVITHIVAQFM